MNESWQQDPALCQLLALGEPGYGDWAEYLALGVTAEHGPELIHMMEDPSLNELDSDDVRVWAPLHAWRALGQLKYEPAIEPLIERLQYAYAQEDDWFLQDFEGLVRQIGPAFAPTLMARLLSKAETEYVRGLCMDCLAALAEQHEELRARFVENLKTELSDAESNSPWVNGMLVYHLIELAPVEATPLIESAYSQGLVDESVCGNWPKVRYDLGLSTRQPPKGPRRWMAGYDLDAPAAMRAEARKQARRQEKKRKKRERKNK
jgi:hypothetical protein